VAIGYINKEGKNEILLNFRSNPENIAWEERQPYEEQQ